MGKHVNLQVEIIANDQGNRTTPSYVAFTDTERLIGDAAKNQVHRFLRLKSYFKVEFSNFDFWMLSYSLILIKLRRLESASLNGGSKSKGSAENCF